jgi:GTPase SAR1 family protein
VSDPGAGLAELIAAVRAEAIALGRDDLAAQLPGPIGAGNTMRRLRIVVAGPSGAGKSSLINSLLGRAGTSPATTGCWVEFRFGAADSATILLADPDDPGTPRRLAADVRDLHAHVTAGEITAPVVGAEVRLDVPVLRELVLVDTPGRPDRTTLAALRQADALLYVADATRPLADAGVAFLVEAARQVPTVAIALNKIEMPANGRAVAETRRLLGDRPELARFAVHTVSAHLAERAGRPGTPHTAAIRLTEAAGVRQLMDRLQYDAAAGAARMRAANQARITAAVTRSLLTHLDRITGPSSRVDDDIAVLTTLLDGGGLLGARFEQARHEAVARFNAAADAIVPPPSSPPPLSPGTPPSSPLLPATASGQSLPDPHQVLAALTLAGVDALEHAQELVLEALRDGLRDDVLIPAAAETDLRLRTPDAARPRALDLLHTVAALVSGSALVVSVLTGAPAVAAGVAASACAGWWRGGDRAVWAEAAVDQAKVAFDAEVRRRVGAVRRYVGETVPLMLETRRDGLARLAPHPEAASSRATLAQVLGDLSRYHRSNA